jgi:hypothetical protein
MMKSARVAVVVAMVIALGVYASRRWWGPERSVVTSEDLIRVAAVEFRRIPMRPVGEFSRASFRQHLETTMVMPSEMPPGAGTTAALLDEFASFFERRYMEPDAEKYIAWRRERGYNLKSYATMNSQWGVGKDYTEIVGSPPASEKDVESIFRTFFDVGLTLGGGVSRPVGLAQQRSGLAIAVGTVTSPSQPRPFVSGELPSSVWHGKTSGTMRNWWEPPRSSRDVLKRDRSLTWAEVGMICEFADGSRRPRIHSFYWDRVANRWMLDSICDYNADMSRVTALEY